MFILALIHSNIEERPQKLLIYTNFQRREYPSITDFTTFLNDFAKCFAEWPFSCLLCGWSKESRIIMIVGSQICFFLTHL
jgi:hypothetical protein